MLSDQKPPKMIQFLKYSRIIKKIIISFHGVPQSSILGPVLFSLYMNDLPDVITNCSVESYVDDTKLFLLLATKDKVGALNLIVQDLDTIANWCCVNQLLINSHKTKFMLFDTRKLVGRLNDITIPFLGKD